LKPGTWKLRNLGAGMLAFFATSVFAQNVLDPFLKAQLDQFYLEAISNIVQQINIAPGSISTDKLDPSFALTPTQITGVALTEPTLFSGPNISGPFNALLIVGFYPDSNPSNFASQAFVLGQGFITGSQVPTFETDPAVSGALGTGVFVDVNFVTNVISVSNGLIKAWTTNGASIF